MALSLSAYVFNENWFTSTEVPYDEVTEYIERKISFLKGKPSVYFRSTKKSNESSFISLFVKLQINSLFFVLLFLEKTKWYTLLYKVKLWKLYYGFESKCWMLVSSGSSSVPNIKGSNLSRKKKSRFRSKCKKSYLCNTLLPTDLRFFAIPEILKTLY